MDFNAISRSNSPSAKKEPAYKKAVERPNTFETQSITSAKPGVANTVAISPQAGATQQAALLKFQLQQNSVHRGNGENIQFASKTTQENNASSTDQPAGKPPEQPDAKPQEQPAANTPEQPDGKPEQPVAKAPDQPAAKATEQPAAKATEQPAAKATEQPAAKAPDQPAAKAPEQPAAKAPEQPAAKAPEQPAAKAPEQPAAKAPEQAAAKENEKPKDYDLVSYPDPSVHDEKGSAKDALKKAEEAQQKKTEEDLKALAQVREAFIKEGIISPEIVRDFFDFANIQENKQLITVRNDLENIAGNKLTTDEIIKAQKILFAPGADGQIPSVEEINRRLEDLKGQYPNNRPDGSRNNTLPHNQFVVLHLTQMAERYKANPSQGMIDLLNNDFLNRRNRLDEFEQKYKVKQSQITDKMLIFRAMSEKSKNGIPLTEDEKMLVERHLAEFLDMKEMKIFEAAAKNSSLSTQLDGENLRVHPIDSPDLSSHWPDNVQIHTATNQNNPAIFRQHVSDWILEMESTDSMTEAAMHMRDKGAFVDVDKKGVKLVTPLASTNMTSENTIWKKNDPNVKRRVVLNIVNDNEADYQDEWVQRDLSQLEDALHANYDLPGAPVEIITIRGKTKAEIKEAIEKLGASADGDTEIMINFQHHGISNHENGTNNTIDDGPTSLPSNESQAQGTAEGKIAVGKNEELTESELKEWLKSMENAKGVLLYIESCYGGAFVA